MFARMSGQRLTADSDGAVSLDEIIRRGVRAEPDVSALASLDRNKVCVLAWHYHDDDVPGPEAVVELTLNSLPLANGEMKLQHFRIDQEHSNAFTAWKRLGSPQQPTPAQYAQLEKAGQLATLAETEPIRVADGKANLRFKLPRQAVSLLQFEW
jgi:xylan 1,4-beta-xylosidase